jgi:hypothetical protein
MTGKDKRMNYPEVYLLRINKRLKERLKKIGSKKVREYLEKLEQSIH